MTDDRARLRPQPIRRQPVRRGSLRSPLGAFAALGLILALALEPGLVAARSDAGSTPALRASAGTLPPARPQPVRRPDRGEPGAPTEQPSPEGPSIIALEAAAHADDRIAFTPGGEVSVPFVPRPDDTWSVGGSAPRKLPAGAASGSEMAASPQGAVWAPSSDAPQARVPLAPSDAPRPVDGAILDPGAVLLADPTGATVTVDDPLDPPAATSLRRQVFGFLPYWELNDSTTTLNYDLLSTIAYFGVGADAKGNLRKRNADGSTSVGWSGWTSSTLTSIIEAAHRNGTRVVLTVQAFAWTSGQATAQAALLDSSTARLNLARQIAAAVRDRGADGVNLDFEPLVSGRGEEFTAFIRTLRTELDRIAPGYQLTFDTTGWIGNYPLEAATAPGGADAVFVMGYDYRTASSPSAGSVAPLSGPAYDLTDTAIAFISRIPASKVIMGVPYYGRAWSTVSDTPNAKTQTGTKYGASASVTYVNAVALAREHGRRYDTREQSPWFAYQRQNCSATYGCVTTWREVYYDDAQSLRAKYDMINRYGLRGAGIWALGYDGTRPELYQALADKFLHDTTPPATGIEVLATKQRDEGFAVGWSASDMSSIRDYDVQVSVDGGPWTAWLTRTSEMGAIHLGGDGHAYAFRARATDVKGNVGSWDVATLPDATPSLAKGGFAVVKVDSLSVRTRPDTSGSLAYKLAAGDVVALTDGPVSADGYTWYEVTGPLETWAPAVPVRAGNWIAVKSSSATYAAARTAPNTTVVDAGISGLSFGAGGPETVGTGAAAIAARAFSPNGDGTEDRLTIRWRNSVGLDSLALKVYRPDGSDIGTRTVPDVAAGAQSWAWDGKVGGDVLPDGRYVIQLVGKDGTRTYSAPSAKPASADQLAAFGVTIDTVAPTLAIATVSAGLLSPNGDGRSDTITLAATSSGGATHWRFSAALLGPDGPGDPVRTIDGVGGAPKLTWDGKADDGAVAKDGTYRLSLTVLDDAGNAVAKAWDVALDTTPPDVAPAAVPEAFSPDGDRAADTAAIRWATGEPVTATVKIYRGTTLVRSFAVTRAATTGAIRWDGKDRSGRRVADGTYQARVQLTDAGGNRGAGAVAVKVDRTAGWLRWGPSAFYPQDRDTLARTSKVTFRLSRTASTTLQVVDATGAVVRTAWTNRRLAAGTRGWTWDGRNASKAFVAPGTYTAVLTATSALGTTTLRRSIVVDAFSVRPSATTLTAGQVLTVKFTTVEPLKTRPVVTFSQPGRAPVVKTARLVSTGRYTVSFKVAAGAAGAATLRIAAKDSAGRSNISVRALTIQ